MTQTYIGVDLSKDWLDIFDPKQGGVLRVPNKETAIRAWLESLDHDAMVVCEATSGCDGVLLSEAGALGRPVHRANPLHCFHFARSLNLAKTDRVDARMLARYGAERHPHATVLGAASQRALAELVGRRDQLKRMETQEKNRLSKASLKAVRADIKDSLADLARRIHTAEAAIRAHLEAHADLAHAATLLETVPGIGPNTSATLLALMPELGTMDRRQAASLAGLAPRARESGRWKGTRHIGDGRRSIRRALYMAAVGLTRKTSPFARAVERMRAANKPGKVIVIALARKIITIANAVLRDQIPFEIAGK